MSTEIYLGNPPENIKKWIKEEAERKYQEMLKTPLTFTASRSCSTIKMISYGSAPTIYLETSPTGEEGSWSDFTVCTYNEDTYEVNNDGTTITLTNIGDKIYFRAKQDNERFGTSEADYNYFEMTGKIAASGNLNTLLKADGSVLDLTGRYYCYTSMFFNCTSLTKAPELPATILAESCYEYMFQNCKSPFTFLDKTFEDVANLIQEKCLIGEHWCYYDEEGNEIIINPIEIICSDKTMLATCDENEWTWVLTEK